MVITLRFDYGEDCWMFVNKLQIDMVIVSIDFSLVNFEDGERKSDRYEMVFILARPTESFVIDVKQSLERI